MLNCFRGGRLKGAAFGVTRFLASLRSRTESFRIAIVCTGKAVGVVGVGGTTGGIAGFSGGIAAGCNALLAAITRAVLSEKSSSK